MGSADLRLPAAIVRELDPESDGDPIVGPSLGRFTDGTFPLGERGVAVGRCGRVEVDMVGDRDLADAPFDRLPCVDVDRYIAVR
jgi:hypothetical protein